MFFDDDDGNDVYTYDEKLSHLLVIYGGPVLNISLVTKVKE